MEQKDETLYDIVDELAVLLADEDRLRTCQATRERVLELEERLDRIMNPEWFARWERLRAWVEAEIAKVTVDAKTVR